MQVRSIFAAALLSVAAVGAMADEIDRHDNPIVASQPARAADAGRTRASVIAETRNLEAQGRIDPVGELSAAPVVSPVPAGTRNAGVSRAQVRAEAAQWNASHHVHLRELG